MKIFYRRPFFAAAFLTAAALIAAILFSCTEHPSITKQPSLIVHYYRYMGDYSGWNVWVWPANVSAEGGDNGSGEAKSFSFDTNKRDAEGFVTAHVIMPDTFKEFGMIIRKSENGNDWAEKDGNDDRFTAEKEVWLKQNDPAIYTAKPETAEPPILFAVADDPKMVSVTLLKEPADYSVFAVYEGGRRLAGTSQKAPVPEETSKDISGENSSATETASPDPAGKKPANARVLISLDEKITDVSKQYVVRDESGVFADQTVTMRNILDSFYYDGNDLGLSYRPDQSVFKVWAPTAADVSVALYDDSGTYNAAGKVTDNETDNLYKMKKDPATGVWSAAIAGNLDGKYYLYRVEGVSHPNWAADPYATAVSANGQRMAIINLESTNPPNWKPNSKPPFSNWQDAVLYELHVRDFSIDENSGMQHKGKFLAFTERGTKNGVSHSGAAKNGARHLFPTGIDHLVNLGITHVHLLPSFDFASINELTVDDPHSVDPKFNWGYDPQNYNVPEGSYSTDPANPRTRITEFKQMVQALHDAGIRVVMDVVYNHTYQTGAGPFDHLVPGYYYRTTDTGAYANGSACGNEVASERPMVRKYIIDSCLYWAKEYNVDGFRFDLMGLIDTPTMKQLTDTLRKQVDPSILIYGEPWQAGGSVLAEDLQTITGAQRGLDFAIFNDRIRWAIKGGSDDDSKGFATGEPDLEAGIVNGIRGSINGVTACANESINYVTAHDNLNLWDKVALSHGAKNLKTDPYSLIKPGKDLFENDAVKSVLLTNGIVFTSQGIPFFQAGDEFLRTKFGDHNSYVSPDSINKICWENAGQYKAVTEYYTGLIKLRKEHPAFRMSAKADMEQKIEIIDEKDNLVSFVIKQNANGDSWRTIFVAYNGSIEPKTVPLPKTASVWQQVVNGQRAGVETIAEISGGSITLPALTMTVLHE